MKIYIVFILLFLFPYVVFCENDTQRGNGMLFIPNKGQIADMQGNIRPELLYVGDGGGYKVFLEKNKIHYVLSKTTGSRDDAKSSGNASWLSESKLKADEAKNLLVNIHRFDVEFVNANENVEVIEDRKVEGYKNFYYSHCSNGVTNVNSFNQLLYKNVYDNIDVVYYGGKENGLKYDIVVKPKADYKQIKLNLSGIDGLEVRDNNLVIETSVGEFVEYMPRVYQQINGKIINVKAEYVLSGINEVEFKIEKYNTSFPLVIDPVNYWVTYLGGSDDDITNDITADATGNMIVVGSTASIGFPGAVGTYQTVLNGLRDVLVSKFSDSGGMLWSTYYGGSGAPGGFGFYEDVGCGVAANSAGDIAITGKCYSPDFPTSAACYQLTLNGTCDMFLVKLTSAGLRDWATLIGGSDPVAAFVKDEAFATCFTSANELVIAGVTSSNDFPVTDGSSLGGSTDIGICKFSSTGSLLKCRYIGGTADEMVSSWIKGCDVIEDHSNNIILVSSSASTDFPVTAGAFQNVLAGGGGFGFTEDVVLLKLNNSLGTVWSTYFGGAESETGLSVDVDANDNIFFTGYTSSMNLPVLNAAQATPGGSSFGGAFTSDVYVASFTTGGAQRWTTYNGGVDYEYNPSLCVDDKDDVYLFASYEDGFVGTMTVFACAFQKNFAGIEDQYFTKYDNSGALVCNSWLGGASEDDIDYCMGGIAEYKGFIYMTSTTFGTGYPVTANAYQSATSACCSNYAGNLADITLVKICGKSCGDNSLATVDFTQTYTQVTICDSASVDFTINYTPCDPKDIIYEWTFQNGSISTSSLAQPTGVRFYDGTHHVKLKITTLCGVDSVEHDVITDVRKPLDYYLGDTTVCIEGETQITIKDAQTAHWTPSSGLNDPNSTTVIIKPSGLVASYTVTGISNIGCTYVLPMTITVGAASGIIFVPNAFTPNNDNLNEIFRVEGEDITEFDLKIYNRWGDLICHSQSLKQGWDL